MAAGLLPVDEALSRLLEGASPLPAEAVAIADAGGRVLAEDVKALRTQPPFDASAMDGYAVRADDISRVPARLAMIGESVAGRRFHGVVGEGEAVRIFTGAPVPEGADTVLLQEDARSIEEGVVETLEATRCGRNIRRAGLDFQIGETLLEAGRTLDPIALSLAAAANHPRLSVVRKPLVAILATGDELVPPGVEPGPDQIVASNVFGVAAIARSAGADVLDLGIAPDREEAIAATVGEALSAKADVVVTLGGASVGDHDLVRGVLTGLGMELSFWKIAMRPGKPLMSGRIGGHRVLGLPGNPVSSLVCAHLFLKPLVARLGGLAAEADIRDAVLSLPMKANDHRQDYVRAHVEPRDGKLVATPFSQQDSSMLKTMASANALIVRAPQAEAANAGDSCRVLLLG
ncbi:gephyrin-like molybdotransferase Glp [Aquamicrobium sp. LC103]|uniref:molybdopterin molybdotransferase MoeA n=1 Tax=Aquamicrobium sp. LC103 TaxID=1120658 RepID=UPI00063EB2DC|nr:gephyrin-like molybdotransferase Glp [Aquamicrobium sp. LC103]TKT79386.1 molybdopterin molybdotransferase MoeA [Aquamicrobium sp. LC103]